MGEEKWIVPTHKVGESIVNEKKLSTIVGDNYTLVIKLIQDNDTLSGHVHPDDEYAKIHENTYGKTECWYILDAEPNATLVCGLNKDYTKDELARAINENTLDNCLRYVPVTKGDFVFIPAGTVHAIQGGLRILEVQEPSDITYRLYDWGRPREIHIEKGLEVTKNDAPDTIHNFNGPFSCEYFTLESKETSGSSENVIFSETDIVKETPSSKTGWITLFILSGSGTLLSSTGEKISVKAEDTIMVNTSEKITAICSDDGSMSIMKIF